MPKGKCFLCPQLLSIMTNLGVLREVVVVMMVMWALPRSRLFRDSVKVFGQNHPFFGHHSSTIVFNLLVDAVKVKEGIVGPLANENDGVDD